MTNILLIENQEKQFDSIYKRFQKDDLSISYTVLPDKDQFINFIDYVRVWVNENYGKYDNEHLTKSENELSYRELAMLRIIQIVSDFNIDIILMDYKLGAGYLSKTGIDLAIEINKIRKIIDIKVLPVIFISKDQSNEKVEKELKDYNGLNRWINKGFFGDEILQPKFIKDYVVKEIENLLLKEKDSSLQIKNETKTRVN